MLMNHFGAFPAPLDRHTTEFFPQFYREGRYFGRTLGVDMFSFEGTIAGGDQEYTSMTEFAYAPGPLPADYFQHIGGEHEQVIDIIDSIRTGRSKVYSANLPNTGQVPNLPLNAVVEAPAVTVDGGLKAIAQAPLPTGIAGTLATRFQWVETVVEAALEGSREKFIQALILDGAAGSIEQAEAIGDDLLTAQAAYLPQMK
jgi:alpha-galactosidase